MNLKNYRQNKGYTQQELADAVGVHVLSIMRYESCQRIPAVDVAARIGEVLVIPNDKLLDLFSGRTV